MRYLKTLHIEALDALQRGCDDRGELLGVDLFENFENRLQNSVYVLLERLLCVHQLLFQHAPQDVVELVERQVDWSWVGSLGVLKVIEDGVPLEELSSYLLEVLLEVDAGVSVQVDDYCLCDDFWKNIEKLRVELAGLQDEVLDEVLPLLEAEFCYVSADDVLQLETGC